MLKITLAFAALDAFMFIMGFVVMPESAFFKAQSVNLLAITVSCLVATVTGVKSEREA